MVASLRGPDSFLFYSNLQGANQEAKVATHRNGATFTEIIAIGASGSFVFFQLLRTVRDFCFSEFFGRFVLLKMAERVGFEPTLSVTLNTLSKRAPSATRPSLRR